MIRFMTGLLVAFLFFLSACSTTDPEGSSTSTSEQSVTANDETESPAIKFVEGTHYTVLDEPIPAAAEVTEFFYFGCVACYQLIPALAEWRRETGNNIELIPAHTEKTLVEGAMLFHTFVVMGILPQMYELGFVMYMTEDSDKYGWERVNEFISQRGVDRQEFWKTMESDAVRERLSYSLSMTRQANVENTPTFVVHGRYKVVSESIETMDDFLTLLTYLADEKEPQVAAISE